MRGRKPSDYPPIKERSAYNRSNVVEVRETSEPQEPRSRERIQAEVVQKEAPEVLEVTMHKSRQIYYSRRSEQTPQPTEEPRGQEGQVQHPGNREKRQEAKDPLKDPDSKAQRGQAGEREATRRREREQE